MTAPLIGLSGRRKKGGDIVGNFDSLANHDIDLYYSDYARAIIQAGGIPVHLPIDLDPAAVVGRLDGVLLSGGADISPDRYGHPLENPAYPPEPERDEFEFAALTQAVDHKLPVLGICRGFQLVNVHAGGTLHQHVPEHAGFESPPHTHLHDVTIESSSLLGSLYGSEKAVNSLHHQTVDVLGASLRSTAVASDGTIEGIEHESLPIVAVQWHPEMMTTRDSDPIFRWLVSQAAA